MASQNISENPSSKSSCAMEIDSYDFENYFSENNVSRSFQNYFPKFNTTEPLINEPISCDNIQNMEKCQTTALDEICHLRGQELTTNLQPKEKLRSSRWQVPWITVANSLVQILIFAAGKRKQFDLFLYSPYKKNELWRFFTYSLLHSDAIHLTINVFIQFLVAFVLETEQGHWKVLLVYMGGTIAGSIGTSIFQPKLLMVGSSAGVYSLLISHIPHLTMNFPSLTHKYFRIVSVIVFCLTDAYYTLYYYVKGECIQPKISLAAHLCGALSGLVLGYAVYSSTKENLFYLHRCLAIIFYAAWIAGAVVYNSWNLLNF